MTILYYLIGYVLITLVADRYGSYAIVRRYGKRYAQEGYIVTVQHRLTSSVLNARKQGEKEIAIRTGWRW